MTTAETLQIDHDLPRTGEEEVKAETETIETETIEAEPTEVEPENISQPGDLETAEAPEHEGAGAEESPAPESRKLQETDSGEAVRMGRIFRILAGLVILGSVFIPFMSTIGYSLFSRIMGMVPDIVPMFIHFFSSPPEIVPRTVPIAYILIITGFVFLILGAIYSFAKGKKGGILGIIGIGMEIAAFSLLAGSFSPLALLLGGPGYYAACAGSITAILSRSFTTR